MEMKTKCRLCEHTFDLFNGYDKYYHYLRHYKERYQFRRVEKVASSTQGLLSDAYSMKCDHCLEELYNFNNLDKYFHYINHYKEMLVEYRRNMTQAEESETEHVSLMTTLKVKADQHKLRWDKENGS